MEKISIEFEFIEILEFILIINSEKQMEWLKRFSPRVLIDKEILEIKSKNNVKIEINHQDCVSRGTLTVIERTGREAPTEKKTQPKERTPEDG